MTGKNFTLALRAASCRKTGGKKANSRLRQLHNHKYSVTVCSIEKSATSGCWYFRERVKKLRLLWTMCDQCMVKFLTTAVAKVTHAEHFPWNQL
jgi:hypothetical protein